MGNDSKYVTKEKFPPTIELSFVENEKRQTLVFEKVVWQQQGTPMSLRYGDNPGQPAAMYRLVNGNLILGDVENIQPNRHLVSNSELLQWGKGPGKINITDADRALALLRTLMDHPTAVIVKHGSPSGVAYDKTLEKALQKAVDCDRVGSFGGCVGLNRPVDLPSAEAILDADADVVIAPDFESGVMNIFQKRPTLRILRVRDIERLANYFFQPVLDFTSLMDGGLVAQWSQIPRQITYDDLKPASVIIEGKRYHCRKDVRADDKEEMLFAWKVACSMRSNAVVFSKNGATVGIGQGQQDSLTAAEVARDKAYRKLADMIARKRTGRPFNAIADSDGANNILTDVQELRGGLIGSVVASDGFFPTPDAVHIGRLEGISGIIQPGGCASDHHVIEACNEFGISMVFTGQRSFVG